MRYWSNCLVLVFLLIMLSNCTSAVHAKSSITAYTGSTAVAIDGKWTAPSEWTDTQNVTFGETVRLHAKHDDQFLYFLVDYVSDTSLDANDFSWIYLDTNNDEGSAPKVDDYGFTIRWTSLNSFTLLMVRGTGNGWGSETSPVEGFTGASSSDASTDPYSTIPHTIYEFKVPRTILGPQGNFGFRASARSTLSGPWQTWPAASSLSNPASWGSLVLSAVPIPEFSLQMTTWILLTSISSTLYLTKRRRTNS